MCNWIIQKYIFCIYIEEYDPRGQQMVKINTVSVFDERCHTVSQSVTCVTQKANLFVRYPLPLEPVEKSTERVLRCWDTYYTT